MNAERLDHTQSLYDLVIVGAGPAGISLAYEARVLGLKAEKILVLEKGPRPAESIRNFYPDDKLVTANYKGNNQECVGNLCLPDSSKEETLAYLQEKLDESKVQAMYSQEVKIIEHRKTGKFLITTAKDSYLTNTCALAIGTLGNPNKPDYEISKDMDDQVHFRVPRLSETPCEVLVVGGGDSASEYAQSLTNKGHEVSLSYRRDNFGRMNDLNLNLAKQLEEQGKLKTLLGTNIHSLERIDNKIKVNFSERDSLSFDHVVYALGGTKPKEFLSSIGITLREEGAESEEHLESEIDGLFLLGDLVAGKKGGSINLAFNNSYRAVKQMCRFYLDCTMCEI